MDISAVSASMFAFRIAYAYMFGSRLFWSPQFQVGFSVPGGWGWFPAGFLVPGKSFGSECTPDDYQKQINHCKYNTPKQ